MSSWRVSRDRTKRVDRMDEVVNIEVKKALILSALDLLFVLKRSFS